MKKGLVLSVLLVMCMAVASAHVSYVLEDDEFSQNIGYDLSFLMGALQNWVNIALIIVTLAVVMVVYFLAPKLRFFNAEKQTIEKVSHEYIDFIPMIARLAVGIALIGAGTSGVLVSPTLASFSILGTLQIFIGFLLFIGLFTGVAAWGAVALYGIALVQTPYMLGNFEFLGLSLLILAMGDGRPGVSDLIGAPFFGKLQKLKPYVPQILAWSIGIAMMYLAIFEKLLNPHTSELVVMQYGLATAIPVSPAMWVLSAGIIEFVIGLALLVRFKPRPMSAIAFVVLSLSFFYFEEAVYSHITLFATLFIMFVIGDRKKLVHGQGKKRKN